MEKDQANKETLLSVSEQSAFTSLLALLDGRIAEYIASTEPANQRKLTSYLFAHTTIEAAMEELDHGLKAGTPSEQ